MTDEEIRSTRMPEKAERRLKLEALIHCIKDKECAPAFTEKEKKHLTCIVEGGSSMKTQELVPELKEICGGPMKIKTVGGKPIEERY